MTIDEEITWLKASAPPCWIRYAIERKLATIDALTAQLTAKDQERKDLAMLVRRLCHALSKTGTHPKVQEQSLDYLKRKGLQGDILRGGDDDAKH